MKKLIKITVCFLILFGCSDDANLLEDIAIRGGYIQFEKTPNLKVNILNVDNAIVSEKLIDPNKNATSYSLNLFYEEKVVTDFLVLNSFPANLEIAISDITSALGMTNADIKLNTKFKFVALVTTPTGTFSGETPKFNNNNINLGGDTTVRLKATALNDAIEFDITFFQPPAKTIRKTSFEEVAVGADDATYTRNGGDNETGALINGANPPFVNYTSVGTSVNDEIGFNSEFIAVDGISSSSLGFSEERIGVTATLEDFSAYPDGSQGFHVEDIDGTVRITFETVQVPSGQNNSGISFQAFYGDTSWEELDGIYAYVNVVRDSGNEVIEMAKLFDDAVEAVSGKWNTYNTGFLNGVRSYQLVIELSNGATPEYTYIDNVIVYETED